MYLLTCVSESTLFILTQVKGDAFKHRVLLDCKRSRVSTSSAKSERVRLPRAMDAVTNILQLSSVGAYWVSDTEVAFEEHVSYEMGFMALDLTDVFFRGGMHLCTRRKGDTSSSNADHGGMSHCARPKGQGMDL